MRWIVKESMAVMIIQEKNWICWWYEQGKLMLKIRQKTEKRGLRKKQACKPKI